MKIIQYCCAVGCLLLRSSDQVYEARGLILAVAVLSHLHHKAEAFETVVKAPQMQGQAQDFQVIV